MSLNGAQDRALMAHLTLGVGLASVLLAVTIRRLRAKHRDKHAVSYRAKAMAPNLDLPFIIEHFARLNDPDYVCVSIAENKLTIGLLLERIAEFGETARRGQVEGVAGNDESAEKEYAKSAREQISNLNSKLASNADGKLLGSTLPTKEGADGNGQTAAVITEQWPINCVGYADLRGPRWVREALAKHMEQRQFKHEVDPDKLCIGAGITSVLRLLFVALAERGQACLIPTPHFAGFDWTFKEAEIERWPVTAPGGGVEVGVDAGISPGLLEQALRSARSNGLEVRLLLLTSPHNPTGRLYSAKALLAAVAWARKRGLHVVVDEVYANCVHRPNANFQSLGKLMMEGPGMGKDVHILYGPGKDMGIPGWRIGAVYSENADVLWAVSMMCHGAQSSALSMEVWGRMLQDQDLCDRHFAQHEDTLREAYMAVTQTLGKEGILYMYAEAGVFLMMDLREFLEEPTEDGELKLWRHILTSTNVSLTPGLSLHCPEPGWYRVCFARERSMEKVCRGLERLGACLRALVAKREGPSAQGSGGRQHACQDKQEPPGVQGDTKVDQDRQPGAGEGSGAGAPPVGEIPRDNQGDDDMIKSPEGDASGTVTPAGVGPSGDLGESFVRVEDGGDVEPSSTRRDDAGAEVAPAEGGSLDEGHGGQPEVSPGNVVDVKPW